MNVRTRANTRTPTAADKLCLAANGSPLKNGGQLEVAIIRPCSGVFGGDDRHLMEKALELSVFPGIGAKALVDLVYVDNVVLGHLLLEAALQCDGKVRALARCVWCARLRWG